jgi:integrase
VRAQSIERNPVPHTVNSAIEEFMDSDQFASLARSSRKRHIIMLNVLREEAGPSKPISQLKRSHIDAAMGNRRARGCQENTLNAYRTTLRMFGRWLLASGYTKTNPCAALKHVRTAPPKSKNKHLSAEQVKAMIKLGWEEHPRDGMTVALLFYTAARSAEIADLKWQDLDFDTEDISIYRSKIKDHHVVPMTASLKEMLLKWEAWVEEHNGPIQDNWYVVPARGHRGFAEGIPFRMTQEWPINLTAKQSSIGPLCKRLMRAIGLTRAELVGKGAHTLRRSAAELLVEATQDLRSAQELLGHASVTQTERYLNRDAASQKYANDIRKWSI